MAKQNVATVSQLEGMGKKTIGGNIQLTPSDWKSVLDLAKEGLHSRGIIKKLKANVKIFKQDIVNLTAQIAELTRKPSISDTMQFIKAKQRAPHRLTEIIADIMCQPPESGMDATRNKTQKNEIDR